jgi:TonB family protein
MPATEIPPQATEPSPQKNGADLLNASRWESAYSELHDTPELVIQLRDDLSRSRQREAFWISVVVHLILVVLLINSKRLETLFPRRAVIAVAPLTEKQKDLTYLELPPDLQKLIKKQKTNIISDKDRMAEARHKIQQKNLLDTPAGTQGPAAPRIKPQRPSPPAAAQNQQPAPQQQQPQPQQPPAKPEPNQSATLQPPPQPRPQPSFKVPDVSPESAIEQATRAATANRGTYGGDGGDFGLGQGRQAPKALGNLDVLSDTMGVDFGPYLQRVLHDVRENWYRVIPESARAPIMKKGKVSIVFIITKNGNVAQMQLSGPSGDVALDRAAWAGITASNPFPALPAQFGGQYLALRFHFYYNPDANDLR